MSDPTMPAGLAAILAEPGWGENDVIWYRDVDQSVDGNPGIYVAVMKPGTEVRLNIDEVTMEALTTDQVAETLGLMLRIEAALAQEGTE